MAHTPAVAGDLVLVGSCNGIFRALEGRTGKVRWETRVGPESAKYYFHGDPYLTPNLVIVGADVSGVPGLTAGVHAFDTTTGQQRWFVPAGRGVAAAIVGSGALALASRLERQILALDVQSGAVRWSFPTEVSGWEAPASANGRVFVGATDGSLSALAADTGRVEWQTKLEAPITTSVSALPTGLYVGTADGSVHRVDAVRGTVITSLKIDDTLGPRSAIVASDGALLVLLADKNEDYRALVSMEETLGRVRWRRAAGERWSTTRVFVSKRAAILGTPSGAIEAFCTTDGSPAWSRDVRGTVRAIGGSDDVVYVSTTDGSLSAFAHVGVCRAK